MATMKLGSKSESSFQLEGQTWVCQNELASDIVIEIGEMSFHLHKFPLLSRSGLLKRIISEIRSSEDGKGCTLRLPDVPGGAKSFELAAKFCYDVKVELTALNVVRLRCAAEHLRMTEEYAEGNLVAQTEAFLDEVLGSWKDTIRALETCEEDGRVVPQAEDLHVVTRCIGSLATKACTDPSIFSWPVSSARSSVRNSEDDGGGGGVLWNGIRPAERPSSSGTTSDWWYEDVSLLSLPLYKRLIMAMESKGMKPENLAGSLTFYAKRHLPGLSRSAGFCGGIASGRTNPTSESGQRSLLEEIVGLLPAKKGVASTKFLLRLLRTAMILHASPSCRDSLEKRVGAQLDDAALEDLLIPNLGYSVETLYDVDCIQRVLDHFLLTTDHQSSAAAVTTSPGIVVDEEGEGEGEGEEQLMGGSSSSPSPPPTPVTMVAKLVDGYLAEVAPDVNLKLTKFQSLAAMIPDYARPLDDGIYRAIDIYLKSHPWLTESEREQLCRLMNCQKLSLEACTHAAQNERLPLRVVVQVLFFEQLRLRTSIAGWFFVSDNMESSHGSSSHTKTAVPKNNNDEITQEVIAKVKDNDLSVDEMKLRVSELEKECLSMKKEIEKLGQTKSSGWSVFSKKFGFGLKSQTSMNSK